MAASTAAVPWIVALVGLYWFAASFFLAKRSLARHSACDGAPALMRETLGLSEAHVQQLLEGGMILGDTRMNTETDSSSLRNGCWMKRQVDSSVVVVVDALRFDFALYHLPRSLGARLIQPTSNNDNANQSINNNTGQLLQFVADPPTVTMQRLKALTTGGLPTFADISNNFGGGTVEDDSWVHLLKQTPWNMRGLDGPTRTACVGDDTWMDLFPTQFDEAYPYPSFNTRDLDTVDNGCLAHIPDLLGRLRRNNNTDNKNDKNALEVVVVHFLGVDHVGHTYGPNNEHMDRKLGQIDQALAHMLETVDENEDSCHAVSIFGDHGMTPDGNHGGGTDEEVTAALFVYFSKGCQSNTDATKGAAASLPDSAWETSRHSDLVRDVFAAVHQIDLVPSLSFLLGLPIPFANLGSLSPALLRASSMEEMATALALNAAQVWQYFSFYSETANRLPNLEQLQNTLLVAVEAYRNAIDHTIITTTDTTATENEDAGASRDRYVQAATLFKVFLAEALDLGQRVWTRFDTIGMATGIGVLSLGTVLWTLPLLLPSSASSSNSMAAPRSGQAPEILAAVVFLVFQCGMLTFSNSYILEEEHTAMYCLAVLSFLVAARQRRQGNSLWVGMIFVAVASRLSELLVSGHGLDPSTGQYWAHNAYVFLSSLFVLVAARWWLFRLGGTNSRVHAMIDSMTLLCLAFSWWEKHLPDSSRNGYTASGMALAFVASSGVYLIGSILRTRKALAGEYQMFSAYYTEIFIKLVLAIICVTGPSSATSLAFYGYQMFMLYRLSLESTSTRISVIVLATLLRFVTRHVFFATNHGCFFNRLQYSAAFVATEEFNFAAGGIQLFLNTFGYEILGILFAFMCSHHPGRETMWRLYGSLQLLESVASCISVTVLRRHLMVWDIYAPHYIWVSVFTAITGIGQIFSCLGRGLDKEPKRNTA